MALASNFTYQNVQIDQFYEDRSQPFVGNRSLWQRWQLEYRYHAWRDRNRPSFGKDPRNYRKKLFLEPAWLDVHEKSGPGEKSYLSKIVEYSVSVLLVHSSVDIKARVAKIGNFLGQKFDSLKNWIRNQMILGCLNLTWVELQNIIDWLICNFENRVFKQWTFCFSATNA